MKSNTLISAMLLFLTATGCGESSLADKGFQVSSDEDELDGEAQTGLSRDSLEIETRPSSVLLTGVPQIRLTTIYKVNENKRDHTTFIGSNSMHYRYDESDEAFGHFWHGNLMPGLAAVYGYNMVNVSHYNIQSQEQTYFFDKPVLIKTLYYPSYLKDTLSYNPVSRNYCMVSVYNEDTNKDHFINLKDLRRLYLFNLNGEKQSALIPENYTVMKSEYDPQNDLMYVFAQLDSNQNGSPDQSEPIHIFWINLKDPTQTGRQY